MNTSAELDLLARLLDDLDQLQHTLVVLETAWRDERGDWDRDDIEESLGWLYKQILQMGERLEHARGTPCMALNDESRQMGKTCPLGEDTREPVLAWMWPISRPGACRN